MLLLLVVFVVLFALFADTSYIRLIVFHVTIEFPASRRRCRFSCPMLLRDEEPSSPLPFSDVYQQRKEALLIKLLPVFAVRCWKIEVRYGYRRRRHLLQSHRCALFVDRATLLADFVAVVVETTVLDVLSSTSTVLSYQKHATTPRRWHYPALRVLSRRLLPRRERPVA